MTEKQFQDNARLELSKLGYITFRINVGQFYDKNGRYITNSIPKGFSDLMVLKDGKTYFIELKVGRNKPTQCQINFINQMQKAGFKAGVAYNINDIKNILEIG